VWLLFFFWFLLIFGPIVRSPLGALGDVSFLMAAGYLTWSIILGRGFHKSLTVFSYIAVTLALIAICNSVLVSDYIDEESFRAIVRPIKGLVVLLGLYFAVTNFSASSLKNVRPPVAYERLLLIAYSTVVMHGVIIVSQFAFPSLRDVTYSVLMDFEVLELNKQFRMPGLAGAGGAQVSAVQGLGFLIGVHLALVRRQYLLFVWGNLILVASFVLTGRTGFVMVGITMLYGFTFILMGRKWRLATVNGMAGRSGNVWSVVVALSAIAIVSFGLALYAEDAWLKQAVDRTFATYFQYAETGELQDRTVTLLGEQYVLPESIGHLLFGDARQFQNRGNYDSDIGYIRLLWGFGLFGLLGHLAFYLFMGYLITRPRIRTIMGTHNIAFGLWMLCGVLVLNYKEPFFFTRMSYPLSLLAVMALYWLSPNKQARAVALPVKLTSSEIRNANLS
jgi:hypothetical protein